MMGVPVSLALHEYCDRGGPSAGPRETLGSYRKVLM